MNKTVNINLGGMIFHIDENAYLKLQNYLNAVRRSFAGASGEDEIVSDIESRIAELFSQKLQNDKQVVSNKEIDEVIEVMGQPEDYMVDEDIFDDEPTASKKNSTTANRKFYRDVDNKYIGGVSSGLGHYFGIDALWVRILWIVLVFTFGTGILFYILLWILIPEANTTAEKIAMTGAPINISNIEKKIKEGFDTASETVKNVDYQKFGNKAQTGISSFFDAIGTIFMTLFKVFGKFIGVLLLLIGTVTVIGLLIGIIATGSIHIFGFEFTDQLAMYDYAGIYPYWVIAVLTFFAAGIPFFFLAYLGLKILVSNLKTIGNIAKFSLLGVWLLAIISLAILGIKTGLKTKENDHVFIKEELAVTAQDTLKIVMNTNELYSSSLRRSDNEQFVYDENNTQYIFSQNVRLIVKSTKDSIGRIRIRKEANGHSHDAARTRAKDINYKYTLENNTLSLNNYFLASPEQKYNNQEVEVTIYLPEGTVIYADDNTYYYHRNNDRYGDILENDDEEHYLRVLEKSTKCLDCPINELDSGVIINENGISITINEDGEKGKVIIGENGIDIDIKETGGDSFELKIDETGIKIKSNE
ncbi:MAG: PspC domain-containing protein [Flavobacteriaceae bacterium]|nr:PspC domain-containing protein [Flavobacteriaceae bacterium]